MARIVVGIDRSPESVAALRWAIEEAAVRGDEVQAIHAWQFPLMVATIEGVVAPAVHVDFRAEARAVAEKIVSEATADKEPAVPVVVETPERSAPNALIAASAGARMLVLGSRGHGAFAGLVLGSVGQQCLQHAQCPVVIIPHVGRRAS